MFSCFRTRRPGLSRSSARRGAARRLWGGKLGIEALEDRRVLSDVVFDGVSSNGSNQITINYTIAGADAAPFSIGFNLSYDDQLNGGDFGGGHASVNTPAELTIGAHSKTVTFGAGFELFDDLQTTDLLHRGLLVTVDAFSELEEPNEANNSGFFRGAFRTSDGDVMAFGDNSYETMAVTKAGSNLKLNFAGAVYTYAAASVNRFIMFGAGGNDTLTMTNIAKPGVLLGGDGDDTLTGGTQADLLDGGGGPDNAPDSDTLTGGAGNDTYRFDNDLWLGADTIVDSGGIDTLDYSLTQLWATTVDLGITSLQGHAPGNFLSLTSATAVENVIGGAASDTLTGNTLANRLEGLGGDDTLIGLGGNDTYAFDVDNDLGTDTVNDSAGTDTLDFSASSADVYVNLAAVGNQTVRNTFLTLNLLSASSIENLIGGDGGDILYGNTLANRIEGRGGRDTMEGGAGNDTYVFVAPVGDESDYVNEASNQGTDTLDFSAIATAVAVDLAVGLGDFTIASHANRSVLTNFTAFENVIGGAGDDTIVGNSLANQLTGNGGNDTLNGGGGKDTLTGGEGDDTLAGGAGDDIYKFDADLFLGSDTINESSGAGGGGIDTLDFTGTTTETVTVQLDNSALQTVTPGKLNLTLVSAISTLENITGGSADDSLIGNGLKNTLIGGAGDDDLLGEGGDDIYKFDADIDQGDDFIYDNAGVDFLDYSLTTIQSVTVNLSLVDALQTVHPANHSLFLHSITTLEGVVGGGKNDTLSSANPSILVGGGGNDSLIGGARSVLIGGAGNDNLQAGADEDLLISGTTSYDTKIASLAIIYSAWNSGDSYATRIASLRAGVSGVKLVAGNTVKNAGTDTLTGGAGLDWFFASVDEIFTDYQASETIDQL